MEAGNAYMNSLTVIQASQGLAQHLSSNPTLGKEGVVIGYDGRHNSYKFAKFAAVAFLFKGIKVFWYGRYAPTPLVAFGVRRLNAAAGIMITASHNAAKDNGYKVYWSDGCQINTPLDEDITRSIDQNLKPWAKAWDTTKIIGHELVEEPLQSVESEYLDAIRRLAESETSSSGPYPSFVYTPMHGVGHRYMCALAAKLGIWDSMVVVRSQAEPDPNFPTVSFPNPEEEHALDEAIETANAEGISLVIATDPDADRFAAAENIG